MGIKTVTGYNFEHEIGKSGPSMVFAWGSWSSSSKTVAELIDSVEENFGEQINILTLDANQESDLVTHLGIKKVPELIFMIEGEVVDKIVGVPEKIDLFEKVHEIIVAESL
ncbi:thioredoxin family protein [Fulvitalea axinellae]